MGEEITTLLKEKKQSRSCDKHRYFMLFSASAVSLDASPKALHYLWRKQRACSLNGFLVTLLCFN